MFDPTQNGHGLADAFVARLDLALSHLIYSTVIGGSLFEDAGIALDVDSAGVVTIVGGTNSSDFPVTPGSYATVKHDSFSDTELYVSRLDPEGKTLLYSTFLGGNGDDGFLSHIGLDVDGLGSATVAAVTQSADFPVTPGAYDESLNGIGNPAITRLDMLPTGVSKIGSSTAGCDGALAIGVTAMPKLGSTTFALTCTNAPALSPRGLVAFSLRALSVPVMVVGAKAWIDPAALLVIAPARSNADGYAVLRVSIPPQPVLAGFSAAAQFFWQDRCAPSGLSASNAVTVTVQP